MGNAGRLTGSPSPENSGVTESTLPTASRQDLFLAQAMLDALPGRVCLVDASGLVRHSNTAWRKHLAPDWGGDGVPSP